MILDELKAIKSGRKELREFGFVMAVALGLIGGLLLWRGRPAYPYFLGGACVFAALGLAAPMALRPLQKAWMALAVMMGFVMTRVILSVLYYLVMTPIALGLRLSGKRFLALGAEEGASTYWRKRESTNKTPEDYERQF